MASPFHIFRKHQKLMLAVICLLAMFAFVFIGPWSNIGSGGAAAENKPVFTWKFGTVRETELAQRRMRRQIVNQYLFKIAAAAKFPLGEPRQFDTSEQRIVTDMLFEKKAEQLGLVPSNALVREFIVAQTGDKLSGPEYASILKSLGTREMGSLSESQLFHYLAQELAVGYALEALYGRTMFRGMHPVMAQYRGDTPADRWQYFQRLNRKVTTQMLPVPVSDFVAEVKDPDEKTLQKFYDDYRNNYPRPEQPTPGFRQPYLAQFEYFKADYATLAAEEAKKVTEEEIKKYYDDFKDFYFRKAKLPSTPTDPATPTDTKPAGDVKPDEKKLDDAKGGDAKAGDEAKVNEPKATEPKAVEPKAGEKSPPAEPKPDEKADEKSPEPKADGKQSRAVIGNFDGELLALADEPPTNPAPATETKADATTAAPVKAEPPAKADEAPKSDATVDPMSDAKSDAKIDDQADPKADGKSDAKPDPRSEPVEYEPLEKVTDQIRDRVAGNKVNQRVSEAFAKLRKVVDDYRIATMRYNRDFKAGLTSAIKPEPPDLAVLAKEFGLEAKTTELINILEARDETDIGKSNRPLMAGSREAPSFLQMAFVPSLETYTPEETEDAENNRYLWWKIAGKEETVPPLADIKTKVLQAWKMVEARKLAEAKAKELAAEVNKAKQPLKEFFANQPGKEVFTAGPFSWFTRQFSQFGPEPRLSEVSGVKYAGYDFFKAIFGLSPGEAGVAPNQPLTVYYVVQIEAEEPPLEQLREQFMAAMSNDMQARGYAAIGMMENSGSFSALVKELETQYGFKLADGKTLLAGREE